MQLLVNIDHVATLRNARGEGYPDPVKAAEVCEQAGAAGVVFHLRGDRRHIKDADVYNLKKSVKGTLDLEMASTQEMISICLDLKPDLATLVPESREELTTEGGLIMSSSMCSDLEKRVVPVLQKENIEISLFLDPVIADIQHAASLGVEAVELHTGTYANAMGDGATRELDRLSKAAELAHSLGLKVNAGHGLNLQNLGPFVAAVPHLNDVSIGHALISDALFMGLEKTVKAYLKIME